MHSRIFCLVSKNQSEEEKENIKKDFKGLTEDEFYDQFQSYGVDYCNDETNLKDDWEWLGRNKACEIYEEDGRFFIRFTKDCIKNYISNKLEKLKEKVDELTLENFDEWVVFDLQNLLNDKHSFWFLINEQYNDYSFDSLLLSMWKDIQQGKNINLDYEVVKSVDYHY